MARQDEGGELDLVVVDEHLQGVGHGLVDGADREVGQPQGRRALDGGGDERGGGLKAHAHEDDLALGVLLRDLEGVERAVDDAYVCPGGLLLVERGARAGHAGHVAKGGDDDLGDARQGDDGVDVAVGGDADGAARPADEVHAFRQDAAKAVAGDGHGVGAADLHEVHLAAAALHGGGGQGVDALDELAAQLWVAKAREV